MLRVVMVPLGSDFHIDETCLVRTPPAGAYVLIREGAKSPAQEDEEFFRRQPALGYRRIDLSGTTGVRLEVGHLVCEIEPGLPSSKMRSTLQSKRAQKLRGALSLAAAIVVHTILLLSSAAAVPPLSPDDPHGGRPRFSPTRRLVGMWAPPTAIDLDRYSLPEDAFVDEEIVADPAPPGGPEDGFRGRPNGGLRSGQTWTPDQGGLGVQGPSDNPDPHIARIPGEWPHSCCDEVFFAPPDGSGPLAPTATWGRDDELGRDPETLRAHRRRGEIGPAPGSRGTNLTGTCEGCRSGGAKAIAPLSPSGIVPLAFVHTVGCATGTSLGPWGRPSPVRDSHLTIGRIVNGHGFWPASVRQVLEEEQDRFRCCYERQAGADPAIAGKVTLSLRLSIEARGIAHAANVESSSGTSPALAQCVADSALGLAFPEPEGISNTITVQLTFGQQEEELR